MKKFYLFIFLFIGIGAQPQLNSNDIKNVVKTNQNLESDDHELVIKSLKNNQEFLDYISKIDKKVILKSVNSKQFVASNKKVFLGNQEIIPFDKIDNNKISDYIIIDCVIYYSTFQIEVKISSSTSSKVQLLMIKLEN